MKKKYILLSFLIVMQYAFVNAQIINIPSDYPTIQQGIDAAADGDTVMVQPGTYPENILIDGKSIVLASTFIITQDTNSIKNTTLDGQWWDETVRIENYADEFTQLTGFSIKNGVRGVLISNSSPTVSHCRIFNNIAPGDVQGGGININGYGGPGQTYNTANVRNCEIYNNESRHGAGISLHNNMGVIENCRIYNNKSWENGSQIMFWYTTTTLRNCRISMNVLLNYIIEFRGGSTPLLENNIITSSASSTVLYSWEASSPILINNTFVNINGQANLAMILPPSHITMFNTLAKGYIMADSMGYQSAYSRFDNEVDGAGNITAEPLLNDDYSLSLCSPCIGAGTVSWTFEDSTYFALLIDYFYNVRPLPGGSNPDMGAAENVLGVPNIPPAITLNPISHTLCEGEAVTIFIEATGSPQLYYQWQKNSVDIPGEVGASLVLSSLQQADEAAYRCLVTNACETKYSYNANIEVLQSPLIQTQPQDLIKYTGSNAQFSVDVTGDQPLSFQWFGPEGLILSGTGSILTINEITQADAGNYYCTIANTCGIATSINASLTVYEPLTINAGPDTYVNIGESTILSGSYSGGSPSLTINWSPETYLYNPNTLQPQTKALYESTTFTLTITDALTGFQSNDDVLITVLDTDTLAYFGLEGDTLYPYNKSGNCGYISGNNCEGDKIKANYYFDEMITYSSEKVLIRFGYAVKSSLAEVPVKIGFWAKSLDSDKPGDLIANTTIPLSQIVEDANAGNTTTINFPQAVALPKHFFVGVFLPQTTGDTVVLNTTKEGTRLIGAAEGTSSIGAAEGTKSIGTAEGTKSIGAAWSLNSENEWISYASDPRFFLMISNAIFPVVKQNNLGIGNNTPLPLEVLIYPNPAKDILSIEILNNQGSAQLQIFDLKGNKIITQTLSQTTSGSRSLINTSTLQSGMYIVKVIQEGKLFTGKLVIMDH